MKQWKSNINRIALLLVKWAALSALIGVLCGGIGAAFGKAIEGVTALRMQYPAILLLLPIAGLVSVWLYRLCRVEGIGTVKVMQSACGGKRVSSLLGPAIFGGTVLTHLAGGSAGKEGAALQLGGSIASRLGKTFRLEQKEQRLLIAAGMAAFFSALFGTPLGAVIFILETIRQGRQVLKAMLPTLLSSLVAFGIAGLCGAHWERYSFQVPALNWAVAAKGLLIAAAGGLVAFAFCLGLHWGEKLFARAVKNPYLRIAFGGLLIVVLTALVGSMDYNGGGLNIIEQTFEGSVRSEAFALKMLFTILTVSAGFKGGEIVPSIFIGATLGGALAGLLGLPIGFAAALGLVAVLSGVTNRPLAIALMGLELFGGLGWGYVVAASLVGYGLSYPISLYSYFEFKNKKTCND